MRNAPILLKFTHKVYFSILHSNILIVCSQKVSINLEKTEFYGFMHLAEISHNTVMQDDSFPKFLQSLSTLLENQYASNSDLIKLLINHVQKFMKMINFSLRFVSIFASLVN